MSLKLLQNYGSDSDSDPELENNEGNSKKQDNADSQFKMHSDEAEDELKKDKFPKLRNRNENNLMKTEKVTSRKSAEKLPLPEELQYMFSSRSPREEDPVLHDGRIRSFPHVRGNWASFVHISLNKSEGVHRQIQLIKTVLKEFPDQAVDFCEDFHLSLSKTLLFRHHWIDSFIFALKEKLAHFEKFSLVFQNFQSYTNEEKTRTFLAMDVYPSQTLFQLVSICDTALAEFELESYYEDPSFHVSLCWALGDQSVLFRMCLIPLLNAKWQSLCEEELGLQVYSVDSIQFKTGNKQCNFGLN